DLSNVRSIVDDDHAAARTRGLALGRGAGLPEIEEALPVLDRPSFESHVRGEHESDACYQRCMELDAILRHVLVPADPETYAGVEAWWSAHTSRALDPIDAAIAGGSVADRVAWAFGSGYAAALRS